MSRISRVSDRKSDLSQDQIPAVQSLEPSPLRKRRGWQAGAIAVSAAAHLGVLAAILMARTDVPHYAHVDPPLVRLVAWTPPPPPKPPAKVPDPSP